MATTPRSPRPVRTEPIPNRSSPCHDLLGREVLKADLGSGEAELEFEATEAFTTGINIQGGLLAAMLDSTLGAALATVLSDAESTVSLEIKVTFIRPGKVGRIRGLARVVHRGRSVAFLEGELRRPDGELIATATTTMRLIQTDENGDFA